MTKPILLPELFSAEDPPLQVVLRSKTRVEVQIGFGDASKSDFGAISTIQTGDNLACVHGQ